MTIRTQLWIGGQWRDAADARTFVDRRPEDDGEYAVAARAGDADVDAAVAAAHAAYQGYRYTLAREREAWMLRAAQLLEERADAFAEVLIDEIGSPVMKARFEIQYAIGHLRTAAGLPRRACGQTLPSDSPGRFGMSVREPLGVFACITPFNVPLIKAMKQCTGPLATGNTVVMLASEEAPVLGAKVAELFHDAGFPPGTFNLLTGIGHEIGDRLVEAPQVRALNFTGSTRVGRHLSELCGRHLKRALLELGGKNPMLILEDADLDVAVPGAVMGMFLYQGQACMAASRILVARPLYETFLERFAAAANSLSLGSLREPSTVIGPIISERQRQRIRDHIADAQAKGARLLTGGEWVGNRCRPTILTGVREGMTCYREETFGPVTAVYPVDDLDHALALANDSAYGLSAAVYTRSLESALKASQQLHAGMVHVNAPTLYDEPHVPFGGVGDSGMGREGAVTDIDHCTEWKWVTIQMPGAAHAH
ncbi:aldehyde dehydrogenase family protein [Polycyclovorans algicola]|uniref:aldehyde dehydrogenase family protein n=1 Tax=Polycyclovorans algicola TaxID=616992 RepID=UPI0004A72909|nr:aldehyde dehydrogenase family protein [Polycyclovorans algicola]